ncbi:inositol monophosphatase family protein [Lyticum sinuosum]|uniref:Inositol-1-monophosphatase n=1 Tax=Lyticum sinuosum TaxID=1332059 RepID=A0AAE4VKU4_9RICK|nr:inositol monophosphatase [Lyticum sinuosum]MDZ5761288.1 Inositol-1-monophosphatase [Lyticum sinuosum]
MSQRPILIDKLLKISQKAGSAVVRDFGELSLLSVETKGSFDFVSSADKQSEKIIAYELQQFRPEYHFLLEESGYIQTTSWEKVQKDGFVRRWVVDPIDGTTNFIRGNPNFVICISLEHIAIPPNITNVNEISKYVQNPKVIAKVLSSMIYYPSYQEVFWAEDGIGAYHIDQYGQQTRINVMPCKEINGAVVNTILHKEKISAFDSVFNFLSDHSVRWRISGSIAKDITYLSSGKNDLVIFAEKLKRWDLSAAYLIGREAGVKIVDLNFKTINNISQMEDNGIIAGHPTFINKLLSAINTNKII